MTREHEALVSIIIPVFNEEENLRELSCRLEESLAGIRYEVIFVNDGSSDHSLAILRELRVSNASFHYLSFSRNFGHQNALMAGLEYAKGDCVVSMDADLQHPPSLILEMIEKWKEGYEVVYTQRLEDENLSFFKRKTSNFFYWLMNRLSDIELEKGTADFRLIDRVIVDLLKRNGEYSLFFRGLVKWMGFRQYKLIYKPSSRFAGKTKYTFGKMLHFALSGITAFSIRPLYLSIVFGATMSLLAFLYGLYAIGVALFTDWAISGWTSTIVSILFIGGLQLLVLGIIGEYLGKIFVQSRGRPRYIIQEEKTD